MIGNSYAAQGKSRQSVEVYTKALELPSLDPHDRLDLLYEVAQAHEQDGNPQGALQYFEEVYMIDQSYRSVAARVQQLRSRLGI
ncbi:tetratricopeptide repeat protein [Myxococcota bacterium]|nr:tetratricopeptide repeat protein [Myxococcota bacterium]